MHCREEKERHARLPLKFSPTRNFRTTGRGWYLLPFRAAHNSAMNNVESAAILQRVCRNTRVVYLRQESSLVM